MEMVCWQPEIAKPSCRLGQWEEVHGGDWSVWAHAWADETTLTCLQWQFCSA
jgi:hypothetical protein